MPEQKIYDKQRQTYNSQTQFIIIFSFT